MRNLKKWSKQFLILCLVLVLGVPVSAEDQKASVHIKTCEDFLTFAENCRLDSFSRGLTVYLDADLDLSNREFRGIPVFTGTFLGQNHCISGIRLEADGSMQGLFRCLGKTALVQQVQVQGSVTPQGSRCQVGGIAGTNEGTVRDCSFEGSISGNEQVGGIAGRNGITGSILNCTMTGNLQGNHFAGGIAGENKGLLKDCTNHASVNDSAQENNVELSDVTIDTLLSTEQASAVTDVAGIAGASSGVIRGCVNHGNIGYAHMGYNVGGIAGTQSGYLAECENTGIISGRKEVGGIVGQMEPVLQIDFSEDTLQILQQQLAGTSVLAGQASANALSGASQMGVKIGVIKDQAQIAQDAIMQLLPSEENPTIPDPDRLLAARNALADSMASMQEAMQDLAQTSQQNMATAAGDFQAISQQLSAMSHTLSNAPQQLGGTIADVSDSDTPEDHTGKTEMCHNTGAVLGDLNVGGIAGAIGMERDLDPGEDHKINGDRSLNFNSQLRGVITGCTNTGTVTGKKKNVGGIAGQMSMGLVRDCVCSSSIDAENGSFLGGIAGTSQGYLRSCAAKCRISGDTHIGGIAGSASRVTDCRTILSITEGKEKLGAILGEYTEISEETPVLGNLYLVADRDWGGIDGISYAGAAEAMQRENFLKMEHLPECFYGSDVSFVFADASVKTFHVPTGKSFPKNSIPEIPPRDGFKAAWQQLRSEDLDPIFFDISFSAEYTPCYVTVKSQTSRPDGKPIMLLEGKFMQETPFALESFEELPVPEKPKEVLECWKIPKPDGSAVTGLRISLPELKKGERAELMLCYENGAWETAESCPDKSYLTVPVTEEVRAVCLVKLPPDFRWIWYGAAGFALALVFAGAVLHIHKKKMKKIPEEDDQSEE